MTIVNTYLSETTETLSGSGDDLVVTSSGSIVNDDGALEHAVILRNRDSRIGLVMIQGLCWRRLEASMDDATLF